MSWLSKAAELLKPKPLARPLSTAPAFPGPLPRPLKPAANIPMSLPGLPAPPDTQQRAIEVETRECTAAEKAINIRNAEALRSARDYKGANVNRFTNDWMTPRTSADAEIYKALWRLRARSRDLERNDPYIRKFLNEVNTNVLGQGGPTLESQITDNRGNPDPVSSALVMKGWADWCENYAGANGYNWMQLNSSALRTTARDGDMLNRHVDGFDNPYGYACQALEPDFMDEYYYQFDVLPNGNQIRMGVEVDQWRKPAAYHILASHPGDYLAGDYLNNGTRIIVRAEDAVHPFICERIDQSRGVPWITAAMLRLRMLDSYEEAALIAARVGANKMGFFVKQVPEGYSGDTDDNGNVVMPSQPGSFEELPMGYDIKTVDWNNPNGNYPAFIKAQLKGISSALSVSYPTIASDLEGVNYSSLRAGTLSERDMWMCLQAWWIYVYIRPIFKRWLKCALLTGAVPLPISKYDLIVKHVFRGRRWSWIDPTAEVNAEMTAINGGLKSRRQSIAERSNMTVEQVDLESGQDAQSASKNGLVVGDNWKQEISTYQLAVLAGAITPCLSDEKYFREKYGLPPVSPEVVEAWAEDGGARKPSMILPQTQAEPPTVPASKPEEPKPEQDQEPGEEKNNT